MKYQKHIFNYVEIELTYPPFSKDVLLLIDFMDFLEKIIHLDLQKQICNQMNWIGSAKWLKIPEFSSELIVKGKIMLKTISDD